MDVTGTPMLSSTYNVWLVLISVLVAMLASYTALDMAGRIAATDGKFARWWLAGGSVAMGSGIWSMHFIGMLPVISRSRQAMTLCLPVFHGWRPFSPLLSP